MTAVADAAASAAMPTGARAPGRLHDRILHVVLFVTVLASSVAFIEPSPHDVLMGVLALACVVAGVRLDYKLVPLLVMLAVWVFGVAASLLNVVADSKAITFAAISAYLAVAAIVFAALFSEDSVRRLATMRTAYILTALIATACAVIGYFRLLPGAEGWFLENGRTSSTFKDPNVFGPFLILPILFLLKDMITRTVRLRDLMIVLALLIGLFLTFSRGAWLHFVLSSGVLLALLFASSASPRTRGRAVVVGIAATAAIAVLAAMLISVDAVNEMFVQRAKTIQDYDIGPGGRFHLQKLALQAVLDYPNGMGPFGFQRLHGLQQHNVYLQAFLVYGWIGGVTYLAMILSTLVTGLRAAFVATPWQPYLICAVAAFVGEVAEGLVIDTDHWRHFFLLLGMVWGLVVATLNWQRRAVPERSAANARHLQRSSRLVGA